MTDIDTGDTVRHIPSDESWLVAFVEGGRLCACGWPCSLVPLSECELVEKASPEARLKLLHDMASMKSNDPRREHAQRALHALTTSGNATAEAVEQCPNCKGTFSPTAIDSEWHGRCECSDRTVATDTLQELHDELYRAQTTHSVEVQVRAIGKARLLLSRYRAALVQTAPAAVPIAWPKARDVGRLGDMSPSGSLRVGLDSDNDVYVAVWGDDGGGNVEFCTPGAGGGQSPRTREALIALMVAMEAENAADPSRDWWARRDRRSTQGKGGADHG